MGLEEDADDIEDFWEDRCIELTTEELGNLQNDRPKKLAD